MTDNRQPEKQNRSTVQPGLFKDLLEKPTVSRELFLPFQRARWEGENYTLGRADRHSVVPEIVGVRLQEPDRNHQDRFREKACQIDLVALVRSVTELRKAPQLSGLVLSDEIIQGYWRRRNSTKIGRVFQPWARPLWQVNNTGHDLSCAMAKKPLS